MKKDKPSFDCDEVNFVLERNRLFSLLNKAYDEHDSMKSKDCQKRELDFVDIAPRGCGFIYTKVGCKNCKFKTESRPLYAEVERSWDGSSQERGPKSAKGNVRVMMTIQNNNRSSISLQRHWFQATECNTGKKALHKSREDNRRIECERHAKMG